MKVRELIEKLSALSNQDAIIAVNGYEGGYDEIELITKRVVEKINKAGSWDGEFDDAPTKYRKKEGSESFLIYVLPRKSS